MKIKSLVCTLALTLFLVTLLSEALTPVTQAQNLAQTQVQVGQVSPEQIQFVAPEGSRQFRVQIYTGVGDLVFDSGETDSQTIYWNKRDQRGNPVGDGSYSASLSAVNAEGSARVRVEPVLVGQAKESEPRAVKQNESMAAKVVTTGTSVADSSGTPNKIVKWNDFGTGLSDSALSEVNGYVGLGTTTPTARLEIYGVQPLDVAGRVPGTNGIDAPSLLVLSGGKGGNSTGAAGNAGAGADIAVIAGNGGDAGTPGQSGTVGRGGDITLQPGAMGTGLGGVALKQRRGTLLLAPQGGLVGIGTTSPTERLTVAGQIQLVDDVSGNGIRFSDGTVQTTAYTAAATSGLTAVSTDGTLAGNGTSSAPLGVNNQSIMGSHIASGQVLKSLNGLQDSVTLQAGPNVTITPAGNTLSISANNTPSGPLTLSGTGPNPILSVKSDGGTAISATGAIEATGAINTSVQYNIGTKRVLSVAGVNNLFAGEDAGNSNTGSQNAFYGPRAGFGNTTGGSNAFFGGTAGLGNTTGSGNAFFGVGAGASNLSGAVNAFFGTGAGSSNVTGSLNTYVGLDAKGTADLQNATAIGSQANVTQNNSLVLGSIKGENGATVDTSVGIGTTAPQAKLEVKGGDILISTPGSKVKFPDGTSQTTAYPGAVTTDGTLTGNGTSSTPLRVNNQSITGSHIANAQVLRSLNGLTDNVTLQAGLNITITSSANTTITSPIAPDTLTVSTKVPMKLSGSGTDPILSVKSADPGGTAISAIGAIDTDVQYNIGTKRVLSTAGFQNLFAGEGAGKSNTGQSNAFYGAGAGFVNALGGANAFFGASAGVKNTSGGGNAFFGFNAGSESVTGIRNTYIGTFATGTANLQHATAIGAEAYVTQDYSLVLGGITGENGATKDTNVGIGTTAPQAKLEVKNGDILISRSGNGIRFSDNTKQTTAYTGTTSPNLTFFGDHAGAANVSGSSNSFFGAYAGTGNTWGAGNTFLGAAAGQENDLGGGNTYVGAGAGQRNTYGYQNVFIGAGTGQNDNGLGNTYIGVAAGTWSSSGRVQGNNTAIGYAAQVDDGLMNATAIGYNAHVSQSNSVVLGQPVLVGIPDVKVGIGTSAPKAKLHVDGGDVFLGTPGQGMILKSPDGTKCARLTIDNKGKLNTDMFTCPN